MAKAMISKLAKQEAIIERGLHSFVEVGNALMKIRDEELYREAGFDGFVAYLESKPWGISRDYAYKQIDAARVSTMVETPELNERQARELAPLLREEGEEAVKEVYEEAIAETNGKTTARVLREKVQKRLPRQKRKEKATDKRSAATVIEQAVFATGMARNAFRLFKNIPPKEISGLIQRAEEAITHWNVILETLRALQDEEVPK